MPQHEADGAITSAEGRVIAVHIGGLQREMTEVKGAMLGIQVSLNAFVRLEERQADFRNALGRAFDEVKIERDARSISDKRIAELERSVSIFIDHGRKITDLQESLIGIERELPGLREMRKFVVAGIMAGVGIILAGIIAMVIINPMQRAYGPPIIKSVPND